MDCIFKDEKSVGLWSRFRQRSREGALGHGKKGAPALLGIADQVLALLRLPPDNRARALKAAGDVGGEWGAALRYALGGEARIGKTPSLWVAAARARGAVRRGQEGGQGGRTRYTRRRSAATPCTAGLLPELRGGGAVAAAPGDVPVGPMSLFMLCRGLNAIDPAAAQAAVDALITMIDDGRLDGEMLGEAMHAFLMTGLVFGKRWPARLKEVASTSVLGRQVVRRALERAMHPGEPQRKLRDVHGWIETLLELSIEAGEAIEDPLARDGLARFLKGGKAAKPAKALLDLAPGERRLTRSAAAVHAIRQRLGRAERWARRHVG